LAQLAELVVAGASTAEPERSRGSNSGTAGAASVGPLDLLVVQPTPFCNLDCSYCYLPDRANKQTIEPDVLERVFAWTFTSGLARAPFTVVWHAGEPMVLGTDFYAAAFEVISRHNSAGVDVGHSIQTNATLVDDAWCDFIRARGIRVGVSVDGPDFLHDRYRRTRSGRGTHERVMRGIDRLRRHGIAFHAIAVLTHASLDYPDEIYDFFVEHEIRQVGFNIEEIEGPHAASSLGAADAERGYRRFMSRFFDLVSRGREPLHVREFDSMLAAVMHGGGDTDPVTQETMPFAIVSVDHMGNLCTYSPELLGLATERYGAFRFGNVCRDSLDDVLACERFRRVRDDVAAGIARCRAECEVFAYCGGGAPANKVFENGSFDSSETLFCRLTRKATLDVVLDKLS
jgi:uncharacterized protein